MNKRSSYYNRKIMIKWIKKVFGIAELIDERKKTNELLKMILDENKKTSHELWLLNRAYNRPR